MLVLCAGERRQVIFGEWVLLVFNGLPYTKKKLNQSFLVIKIINFIFRKIYYAIHKTVTIFFYNHGISEMSSLKIVIAIPSLLNAVVIMVWLRKQSPKALCVAVRGAIIVVVERE
jgi:hypothetical protein